MSRRAEFRQRLGEADLAHLDARVIALHLLGAERFADLTGLLFDGMRNGEIRAQTCTMTLFQLLAEPFRRRQPELALEAERLLTACRGLSWVAPGTAEARQAARARSELGGSTERAFQVATAVEGGADLFVTEGSGLRRIAGMAVVNLEDYLAS